MNELEELTTIQEFWNDIENSQKVLQEIKALKNKIALYDNLYSQYEDLMILIELGNEEEDISVLKEAEKLTEIFINDFDVLQVETLLSGEYDKNNAVITLHSGAGGTDACDWTEMLLRMYTRWCEKKGFTVDIIDYLEGDGAGVKSATLTITGINAYGYLKAEKGVHRLVRLSPFDSSGKRHTSFASCDVMPELDDDFDLEIASDDLRIDTYRASGAGGQHVNKTESAIRITHIPTNTVVQCQNERSQHKNKDTAMKVLRSRLFKLKQEEQLAKATDIRGELLDNGFGSQIRSYVFHPYNMVKDHRTNAESGNVQGVMNGNIDIFINAYLNYCQLEYR